MANVFYHFLSYSNADFSSWFMCWFIIPLFKILNWFLFTWWKCESFDYFCEEVMFIFVQFINDSLDCQWTRVVLSIGPISSDFCIFLPIDSVWLAVTCTKNLKVGYTGTGCNCISIEMWAKHTLVQRKDVGIMTEVERFIVLDNKSSDCRSVDGSFSWKGEHVNRSHIYSRFVMLLSML